MATNKKAKVPISERALIQRINRKLKRDGEQLRRARGSQMELSVGAYYIVDVTRNFLASHDVDLENLGRELGVLQGWEAIQGA